MLAVEVEVTMHSLLLPDTVVEPRANVPATPVRVRPDVVLDVVVTLAKAEVAANVPVARFNAWPLPLSVTSGDELLPTVSVPKLVPEIFVPVVVLTVKPRSVLPLPRLMALLALVIVTAGAPVFMAGKGSVPLGALSPLIVSRLAVASCPMNF